MKRLLICPGPRAAVRHLAESQPLVLVPVLGQSLLEYWLSHLACTGVKQIALLTNDRPEWVDAIVGDGGRWGMTIEVFPVAKELTPAEAQLQHSAAEQMPVVVLDHFPGLPQFPLYSSYADWFHGMQAWLPQARMPDRVGIRQPSPGIWTALSTRISPSAQVKAPCWLGRNVLVGPDAVIGPNAVIEDGCIIEAAAEITASYVSRDTLVGQGLELSHSLAAGSTLINWQTGSMAEVPDAFVLCALRRTPFWKAPNWLGRLSDLWCRDKEETGVLLRNFLIRRQG